jgi:hypothetical protein
MSLRAEPWLYSAQAIHPPLARLLPYPHCLPCIHHYLDSGSRSCYASPIQSGARLAQHVGVNSPPSCCLQVDKWGVCGGISSFGSNSSAPGTCCPLGYTCQWYTDFFWQCMPVGMAAGSNKPVGTWDNACAGAKVSCAARQHYCAALPDLTPVPALPKPTSGRLMPMQALKLHC